MGSLFTEIMRTVGVQTIIDMLKKAWGQCSSYINANRNLEVLKSKTEELSKREQDVEMELERHESNQGKKRKPEVELWQQNAKKVKDDVQSKIDDIENRRWLSLRRYRSVMRLETEIEKIVELQKKGEFPDGLVVEDLPTSSLIGQTTAHKTLETIWNCLMDVKIGKIGVHGMGGVGKTTIMKHIYNRLGTDPHFDNVIWVTVSKDLNLERLQNDIAKAIELRFLEDEDELRRSKAICAKLKGRKKFLLILDDMWEAFPLERIGIPEPNQRNGYKVVFTTRDLRICRRMESDVDIKVEVLSNEEAWDLFKDKVGSDVVLSSNLQDVAKLVAQECGRLPLAIITVGRALRKNNDVREWENALYELRGSSSEIRDMETDVFKSLRFSYDRLRNDKVRACFLYCALYPEYFEIPREDLIEYWMGEGLIEEKENRAAILNKGHAVLNELRDACILESGLGYHPIERVKMHDLLRDMAISITRSKPRFVVEAGNKLKDSLKEDAWVENVERISLMMNNIKRLPSQPNCPNLSTLLLQKNHLLHSVPNLFFHHMKGLRVLDLSYTCIESLPESITELENLRLLILRHCWALQKVPSLRQLKALRVLDLGGTKIEELPDGMEEMFSLRRLDLSETNNLRTFQAGILPNLSSLEDLDMSQSNWKWSSYSVGNVTAVSEELRSLTRLTKIRVHFSDLLSSMPCMKLPELDDFFFRIGFPNDVRARSLLEGPCLAGSFSRCVEVYGCNTVRQYGSLLLPDKTQFLYFEECNLPDRLSKLPCISNLKELKKCCIDICDELEFILAANEGATILSTLETLYLKRLPNLRALCSGVVSLPTFTDLKVLLVSWCNGLRNLISFKLLQHLRNLESLEVSDCASLEEIIAGEDQDESKIVLPKLRLLVLENLPELKRISTQSLICSSLKNIKVKKCSQLRKLLSIYNPISNPFGSLIEGSVEWWDALEWDDPNTKTLLHPLFHERGEVVEEEEESPSATAPYLPSLSTSASPSPASPAPSSMAPMSPTPF